MRYFKHDKNHKVFEIPPDKEFLIHYDWIEISESEYQQKKAEQESAERIEFEVELSESRRKEIMNRLLEIDVESIRPLRAVATNIDDLVDHQKLKSLNEERHSLMVMMLKNSHH